MFSDVTSVTAAPGPRRIGRMAAVAAILLTVAGCSGDSKGGSAAGEHPAPNEAMPAHMPDYPGAASVKIRDMVYAKDMPPLPFATFKTADSPMQVADFYAAAAQRAGFEVVQRRDSGASVRLVLRDELHRLSVNAQKRDGAPTSVQIGLAVRPDRRKAADGTAD